MLTPAPMSQMKLAAVLAMGLAIAACNPSARTQIDYESLQRARELAKAHILVDGHIDVPYRMSRKSEDISMPTQGHFDYPRAVVGGLDAPFMSIYLPAERQKTPGASKALADSLIDLVEGFVDRSPGKFALTYSPDEVRSNFESGLMSLPMGMENGSGLEGDLSNLQHFHDRGIRYITLTHSKVNRISDSSYDTTRTWNGLSEFGEDVVREMNRLGIMVDISHVSDSAFYDVMEITAAPAIASHSSARHFTPGWERNMSDEMIRRLAENGGIIMINFGCTFLTKESRQASERISKFREERDLSQDDPEYVKFRRENTHHADVQDVIDHINHVVALVGVEHVGIGSDFDGVSWVPKGLNDVSQYPNLIALLIQEGYTDEDVARILGENLLRVWSEVETVAAGMADRPRTSP